MLLEVKVVQNALHILMRPDAIGSVVHTCQDVHVLKKLAIGSSLLFLCIMSHQTTSSTPFLVSAQMDVSEKSKCFGISFPVQSHEEVSLWAKDACISGHQEALIYQSSCSQHITLVDIKHGVLLSATIWNMQESHSNKGIQYLVGKAWREQMI